MKKKFFAIIALFLILPCAFLFSGCGEQFIEERTYSLLGMTVVRDNTPTTGGYAHFDDGEYATSLTGGMYFEKCSLDVGRESCLFVFNDEATGVKASYKFKVYTDESVYPAYSYVSSSITINGQNAKNLTEEQIAALEADVLDIYTDVMQFTAICEYGDVSIQLVTQNKSFSCHIVILDKETEDLVFMGMIYGF